MKKTTIIKMISFLFAGLILFQTACNKDDDEKTNKDLLTGKNWQVTAVTVDPPIEIMGVQYTDLYAFMPDCSKDDFTKYNSDGTTVWDEGPTKCDAGDPQTTTGTWSMNSDQTKITITEDGESVEYTISEISESNMKIIYVTTEDLGTGTVETYTITVTFKKI